MYATCGGSRMGLHSEYIGFAVFNLLETLHINWFALLDSGHAQLCFFKFYCWWSLKSFTKVKPLRGLSEQFSYFPLSVFHIIFLWIECKCTLQTKCSVQLNMKGSNTYFFLACPSGLWLVKLLWAFSFLQSILKIIVQNRMWKLLGERVRSICLWIVSCSSGSSLNCYVPLSNNTSHPVVLPFLQLFLHN